MRSIATAFFFALVFKQDEAVFSCNPILNDYVTHQEKLKCITITDVASSDLVFQQAAFRSFVAGKKRKVWSNQLKTDYAWYISQSHFCLKYLMAKVSDYNNFQIQNTSGKKPEDNKEGAHCSKVFTAKFMLQKW